MNTRDSSRGQRAGDPAHIALTVLSAAIAAAYIGAIAAFIARECFFVGDDFPVFWLAKTSRLTQTLWSPIGGQVVPFAQALNAVLYRNFGLSYPAALAILFGFHVLGVLSLYQNLQLLRPSRINVVLTVIYATFVYHFVELSWWSAGLQRLPYAVASLFAIAEYIRYSRTGARGHLVAFSLLVLLSLGFYGKAVLLPVVLVALDFACPELAPRGQTELGRRTRAKWIACCALTAAGLVYVPLARHVVGAPSGWGPSDPIFQLQFQKASLMVFGHALLGMPFVYRQTVPSTVVAAAWIAFAIYTSYRAPRSIRAWAAGTLILVLNTLMVGVSIRAGMFGILMAFEPRYQFDLAFPAILFVGVVVHHLPSGARELAWLSDPRRRWVLAILVVGALAAHTGACYRNTVRAAFVYSRDMPSTRRFMDNLRTDLANAQRRSRTAAPLTFVDSQLPVYMTGFDWTCTRVWQLLALMEIRAEFPPTGEAEYRVRPDGHVVAR